MPAARQAAHGELRGLCNPVDLFRKQRRCEQQRVLLALHSDQHIALQIFCCNKPGSFAAPLDAADSQPLPLSDGVVHQSLVSTQYLSLGSLYIAGLRRQILRQEITKAALADKTDAGAVFFVVGLQTGLQRHGAYIRLVDVPQGEACMGELMLV